MSPRSKLQTKECTDSGPIAELAKRIQVSQVDRPLGVTDGIWDAQDQAAVQQSSRDSDSTGV